MEGATGLWNTNLRGKAQACLYALLDLDCVYVHVEAPDEASHEGNLDRKFGSIEDLDRRLIGPLLAELPAPRARGCGAAAHHPTPVEKRIHIHGDVPFAIRARDRGGQGRALRRGRMRQGRLWTARRRPVHQGRAGGE